MDGLMRFDAEGDPTVDRGDPRAEEVATPQEAWGTGAGDADGDDAAGPTATAPLSGGDEGPEEGPWDVFWGRQAPGTDADPFGWSDELLAPEPVLGADDIPLSGVVEVDEPDPGAGEGEMDAGPV